MRLYEKFKFKYHALTTPTVTPLDRIVKATTQTIAAVIQLQGNKPPDELQAIENLRALITGNNVAPSNQALEAAEQADDTIIADTPPQDQEPDPKPAPKPVSITVPVKDCDFPIFATNFKPAADNGNQQELIS